MFVNHDSADGLVSCVTMSTYVKNTYTTTEHKQSGKNEQRRSWIKALATKLNDLSLIPGTHKVEEKTDFCKLSSDLHMYIMVHMCYTHTYKHQK